jgi:hypothetical protein
MKRLIALFFTAIMFSACQQETPVEVLATTSVMADAARQILPEEIQVVALMQSNIDPHSYKPVESDVAKLNSATIVDFWPFSTRSIATILLPTQSAMLQNCAQHMQILPLHLWTFQTQIELWSRHTTPSLISVVHSPLRSRDCKG